MRFDHVFDDRQPKPRAAEFGLTRFIDAEETLENVRQVTLGDAE